MAVEDTIIASLTALVSGRVYPDRIPESVSTWPSISFQQVGGLAVNVLSQMPLPDVKNGRFQVNVWSTTRKQSADLGRLVEDTLRLATALRTTVLSAPVATYDVSTQLYSTRQDFSFWFS